MDAAAALGGLGTFIGLVRALPQFIRLLRAKDAHGVSLDSAATSCVVSSAWATYGVLTDQLAVVLASGLSAVVFAMITILALRFGRRTRELRAAPAWLTVVTVVLAIAGSAGLGVVLAVSALVANLPQVVVAYRERDLTGLSPSTWALTASDGAVWSLYGVVSGDVPILINNLFQFSTSAAIVARRVSWDRQRRMSSD
ncbi:MAG TPA: PQ-loop domain-containing transporter [Actinomycetota bacterium]|nr:PQ-loop domain-containing transporter [Actinomycetota bacterium]